MTPSPFVIQWTDAVARVVAAPARALDVAMGRGRHALALARAGFRTFGVDATLDAVRDGVVRAAAEGLSVRGWCADLTRSPLPRERFELVLVTRFLQRDLFGSIRQAVVPTGVIMYETFTVNLSAPTNATIATGTGTGTIVNDDAPALPTLSINNVSANEGNSGTTAFTFTVVARRPRWDGATG